MLSPAAEFSRDPLGLDCCLVPTLLLCAGQAEELMVLLVLAHILHPIVLFLVHQLLKS